jgi:hypothetical protein
MIRGGHVFLCVIALVIGVPCIGGNLPGALVRFSFSSNCRIARSSFRISSACCRVIPESLALSDGDGSCADLVYASDQPRSVANSHPSGGVS